MVSLSIITQGEYAHSVELALIRHELSQPLTFLMTSLSLLKLRLDRELESCEGAHSLLAILSAAQESAGHIGDMVRRIGAQGSDEIGPVDLAELVERTLLIAEDGIEPHAMLVPEIGCRPIVNANATRLRQVLLNLLTNAAFAVRDRAEGRGSIVVRVRCDGHDARHVTLDVVDDGVGIRERERAMVGEVHFTTRPDVGRGFGLALCRSIVESYGGSFRLDPARPHGTRARVVLPVLHFEAAGEKRS